MKKIIVLIILSFSSLGLSQNYDISLDQITRSGNVLIKRLTSYDAEVKGNPYLEKDFKSGKLIFKNGKQYDVFLRLDVSEQKFEIKKNIQAEASAIEIDESVTVKIMDNTYKLHSFSFGSLSKTIGILEECLVLDKYGLYYFPQKKIEMPKKSGIPAPASGYSKPAKAEWKNNGVYLIFYNNKTYKLPTSHKKMVELNLFDKKEYKKYRKENKLNLKNKESLIRLVTYFNSL
jgi:hypothetical protein